MPYNYQYDEEPLPLGQLGEVLPSEISNRYFDNLDKALQRAEKVQLERTLGDLGDRGFLRSGDTLKAVSEQVLGPSIERRNQVLLPELQRAAGQGREERLQGVQFDRTKELTAIQHQNRLEEIQKQAEVQRMLMELENSLSGGNFLESFGGLAAGNLTGSIFGGIGGKLGGGIGDSLTKKFGF